MSEPNWPERRLVIAAHDYWIKETGGFPGLRDDGLLLDTALASQRNLWCYEQVDDLFVLAANLLRALNKYHVFNDANKRTSFDAARLFLGANGIQITVSDDDVVAYTLKAAETETEEDREAVEKEIADWLRRSVDKPGGSSAKRVRFFNLFSRIRGMDSY